MAQVTVLMAAYNAMPYLPEAVESILKQTFRDFIFLIINDGSTDGSRAYIDGLRDPRVRVVHQPNRGQGLARTFGLTMCDSEFVAIMDADDVSVPTRIEAQLNFLRSHSDTGLVGTQVTYLGFGGRTGISPPTPLDHEFIYAALICGRAAFFPATMMCRTSILKRIGGYRVERAGEDMDMLLRMGETTRLANLKEVLYLIRLHSGSTMETRLTEAWTQYAYARDGAKRRKEGLPEITFDEFVIVQLARPIWRQALDVMDLYAYGQYRHALAEILSPHFAVGYCRLIWAALCSPYRTLRRIYRINKKPRKS